MLRHPGISRESCSQGVCCLGKQWGRGMDTSALLTPDSESNKPARQPQLLYFVDGGCNFFYLFCFCSLKIYLCLPILLHLLSLIPRPDSTIMNTPLPRHPFPRQWCQWWGLSTLPSQRVPSANNLTENDNQPSDWLAERPEDEQPFSSRKTVAAGSRCWT